MKPKEILQLVLTAAIVGGYIYLVVTGKANVEGYIFLAIYTIKKFLDIVETKEEAK